MFRLLIECSKDIDKLSIDFSDGTSVITDKSGAVSETPKKKKTEVERPVEKPVERPKKSSENVLIPEDFCYNKSESTEVIKPPEIPDLDRPPKIDDILDDLKL